MWVQKSEYTYICVDIHIRKQETITCRKHLPSFVCSAFEAIPPFWEDSLKSEPFWESSESVVCTLLLWIWTECDRGRVGSWSQCPLATSVMGRGICPVLTRARSAHWDLQVRWWSGRVFHPVDSVGDLTVVLAAESFLPRVCLSSRPALWSLQCFLRLPSIHLFLFCLILAGKVCVACKLEPGWGLL